MFQNEWSIKDEIMIRIYTLVYGRMGFYKYIAKRILGILREEKVPVRKYVVYFEFMCRMLEEAIADEIDKMLNEKERQELEAFLKELERMYIW